MALVLRKEKLTPWLAELASSRRLVAPSEVGEKVLFRQVESPEQVVLDYANTLLSPKEWFFPQTDTILKARREGKNITEVTSTVDETPRVIFGIRPCDARGLVVLDAVSLSDPVDSYYQARRQNTILVGIACQQPSVGCFCTSVGTGPDDGKNLDVLLTPVEAGYVVEAVTDKGKAALADAKIEEMAVEMPPKPEIAALPMENLQATLWKTFNDEIWSRIADRCLGCRACTYLCPTCYCFNVRDYEDKDGTVNRLRGWDSCQAVGFYRLAGGHNPRPTKTSRYRQRFYHKFLYLPDRFGEVGCVGCGRCVENCPVNVDVREIITKVVKEQEKVSVESV